MLCFKGAVEKQKFDMLNYALGQFSGLTEILAPVGGPQQKLYLAIQHGKNEEAQQIIYSGGCDFSGNGESGQLHFSFLLSF